MYLPTIAVILAGISPILVSADFDIDRDDIPRACSAICRPLVELTQTCDVRDDQIDNDQTEDLLEAQCVCTNDSFDVANITGLCASCMDQNISGTEDWDDAYVAIHSVMDTCGFSITSYASEASTAADTITVVAIKPTAASQLTTTISTGVGSVKASSTASQTSSSTSSEQTGQGETSTPSTSEPSTSTSSASPSSTSTPSTTPNAAPVTVPMGGGSMTLGVYLVGLMIVGGMALA